MLIHHISFLHVNYRKETVDIITHVGKGSTRFNIFQPRFTIRLELGVKVDSASNGTIFNLSHRSETVSYGHNICSWGPFQRYLLERFPISLESGVKPLVSGAEQNSASNVTIFKLGHRSKSTTYGQNTPLWSPPEALLKAIQWYDSLYYLSWI